MCLSFSLLGIGTAESEFATKADNVRLLPLSSKIRTLKCHLHINDIAQYPEPHESSSTNALSEKSQLPLVYIRLAFCFSIKLEDLHRQHAANTLPGSLYVP